MFMVAHILAHNKVASDSPRIFASPTEDIIMFQFSSKVLLVNSVYALLSGLLEEVALLE
jgi:hypothetical protein